MLSHLAHSSQKITDIESFKSWTRLELGKVLPFQAAAFGYGRMHSGGVATDYIVTIDFPRSHFQEICNPAGGIESPLLRRWLKTETPFYFEPSEHAHWPEISPQWLNAFNKNELKNAAVHAKFDSEKYVGSYFSFHKFPNPLTADIPPLLNQLIPILHETLCRVIRDFEKQEQRLQPEWSLLNRRELEIVTWIGRGKSNSEIAELIYLSENTVKHHISRIMQKLDMTNRVQLAAAYLAHPPGFVSKGTKVL